jgi:hypothetical protein
MLLSIPSLIIAPLVTCLIPLFLFASSFLHRLDLTFLRFADANHSQATISTADDLSTATIVVTSLGRIVSVRIVCIRIVPAVCNGILLCALLR